MLRMFAQWAERLYPQRRLFALIALGMFLLLAIASMGGWGLGATIFGIAAGPLVFFPWSLYLLCVWFHPEHGVVSRVGTLPLAVQTLKKYLFACFLVFYVVVALVALPTFSLWSHPFTCLMLRLVSQERCIA